MPLQVTIFNMETAHADHVRRNLLEDGEVQAAMHDPKEAEMDLTGIDWKAWMADAYFRAQTLFDTAYRQFGTPENASPSFPP